MTDESVSYATHLDVKFGALERVALDPLVAAVRDQWYNQTLVRVNDSVVRLGVMQGEYHWHEHPNDDEFFFVLEGRFLIDLEPEPDGVTAGRVVTLAPREGFVVPKGVRHRPRAPERSVIFLVETASIMPTGSQVAEAISGPPLLNAHAGLDILLASETLKYTGSFKFRAREPRVNDR